MKVTILASGSKGNSTLIETTDKNILIDAGLPLSNLEKRINKSLPKIDILIITHTHTDHIGGIKSVLKKHSPKIYTIEHNLNEKIPNYDDIKYENKIEEQDLNIKLIELSHDVPCLGVIIKSNEKELVYITDTGYIKEKYLNEYKNKYIYILESNYEPEMLRNSSYPFKIRQRIGSDKGHLSNDDTCRYIKTLIGNNTKYLCMAHISEENNTPEIVKEKVTNTIEKIDNNIKKVIICSQEEAIELEI